MAFCLLGYVLFFAALLPVWGKLSSSLGLMLTDEAPTFGSNLSVVYSSEAYMAARQAQTQGTSYLSGEWVNFPNEGELYGKIVCRKMGLEAPVYWGDTDEILMYGVGQSAISLPPGFGSAVILSGHNNTNFQCLQNAAVGNMIRFYTNYGKYRYHVTRVEVIDEKELERILIDAAADDAEEQLILYTCYPFHVVAGRKTDRLVVFAKKTSGLEVKWRAED